MSKEITITATEVLVEQHDGTEHRFPSVWDREAMYVNESDAPEHVLEYAEADPDVSAILPVDGVHQTEYRALDPRTEGDTKTTYFLHERPPEACVEVPERHDSVPYRDVRSALKLHEDTEPRYISTAYFFPALELVEVWFDHEPGHLEMSSVAGDYKRLPMEDIRGVTWETEDELLDELEEKKRHREEGPSAEELFGPDEITCPHCDEEFEGEDWRDRHVEQVHGDEFDCECGFETAYEGQLKNHQKHCDQADDVGLYGDEAGRGDDSVTGEATHPDETDYDSGGVYPDQ
ncbi:hypothetical protein DVK00_02925 [Haloarcula sp. Atlit-47R]|uniref:hypothetical protein n=1 Tax=Haloarcula sp. Atlit-47R TaxID=2282132 RepID=UPI000EF26377|nr:hypothetical protein [Haloarcula sp. Atlit-47R]RLM47477.1 hypothetical protein DVK00_02925 [Haloarcula sp. Atlit-47R]